MTKTIVLIATLIVASASPVFAQGVEPAAPDQKTGIIDTLTEQADAIRCAIVRDDIRDDKIMLSECEHKRPAVERPNSNDQGNQPSDR
jgi:hypothetical protein